MMQSIFQSDSLSHLNLEKLEVLKEYLLEKKEVKGRFIDDTLAREILLSF